MTDLLVIGEGHGEVRASARLAAKVLAAHGSARGDPFHTVREAMRFPILGAGQLEQAAEIARRERPSALLVTSDLDDRCPSDMAPQLSARLRSAGLPFPARSCCSTASTRPSSSPRPHLWRAGRST